MSLESVILCILKHVVIGYAVEFCLAQLCAGNVTVRGLSMKATAYVFRLCILAVLIIVPSSGLPFGHKTINLS